MNHRDKELYIDLVQRIAKQSRARRLQVGALLVNDGVMIMGYNGTPRGWDNNCENEIVTSYQPVGMSLGPNGLSSFGSGKIELKTKPEVIHAEMNVFKKCANNPNVIKGGTLFVTHAPCMECSKLFFSMGLEEVIYINDYRTTDGLDALKKDGIRVTKWEPNASV